MKTIRWGIIGCGDVAEVKSGPGFYKADHSSLVAVMRRNGARAAEFAERHGVARWSDDAQAIINAPDIDVVYISTLTNSHCLYTLRCAHAGKPVYVEKGCRGGVEARYRSGLAAPVAMTRLRGVDLAESYPRSVASTPSSNWTCGFPASSSRTGVTCQHASRGGV